MNNYGDNKKVQVQSKASSGGIGFFGLLTIAFIVLKLIGVIDWSWIWVLAPTWIPLALVLGILILAGIIYCIIKLVRRLRGGKRK